MWREGLTGLIVILEEELAGCAKGYEIKGFTIIFAKLGGARGLTGRCLPLLCTAADLSALILVMLVLSPPLLVDLF